MGGALILLIKSLGSTGVTIVPGPFCVEAAEVFSPGSTKAEVYSPGAAAQETYSPGAVKTQVNC